MNNTVYLESFVENVGFLPPELIRIFNLIKSLDDKCEELLEEIRKEPELILEQSQNSSSRSSLKQDVIAAQLQLKRNHKLLMQFSDEKYRLSQQAFEVLQMHYIQLAGDMGSLKQELHDQAGALDGYEEQSVQPEPRRLTRAKDGKKERMSSSTRAHSGISGLTPQPATPPHSTQSVSAQLGPPDLTTDVRMQEAMLSMNQGQSQRLEDMPISEDVLFQVRPPPGMSHSAKSPQAPGRLLTNDDISSSLQGRKAELFWPDDNLWYLIEIHRVDVVARSAQIIYTTGETEILNLDEIVQEGHMSLIT